MAKKIKIAHLPVRNADDHEHPRVGDLEQGTSKTRTASAHGRRRQCVAISSVLRSQALAAPVTVYVEQFSAHPLESDVAELYAPPDGFLNSAGEFLRRGRTDRIGRSTRSRLILKMDIIRCRTWRARPDG